MKHPHHDVICEWAADMTKIVQFRPDPKSEWVDVEGAPIWYIDDEFRIKPEPKPDQVFDFIMELKADFRFPRIRFSEHWELPNVRITFDGDYNLKEITKL